MTDAPDFSGETVEAAADVMGLLAELVARIRLKQVAVIQATAALDVVQAELDALLMRDVPAAMEQAGMTELTMKDGAVLKVKDDIKVNITEANAAAAYAWLRANGHGASIAEQMIIDMRALEEEDRDKLVDQLMQGFEIHPETKQSIHNATLKSLVKEMLEKGETPPSSIGLYQYKKAELKEPKVTKAKGTKK